MYGDSVRKIVCIVQRSTSSNTKAFSKSCSISNTGVCTCTPTARFMANKDGPSKRTCDHINHRKGTSAEKPRNISNARQIDAYTMAMQWSGNGYNLSCDNCATFANEDDRALPF